MDPTTLDFQPRSASRAGRLRDPFMPGCHRARTSGRAHPSPEYAAASVRLSLVDWGTRELAPHLGPPSRRLRTFLEMAALVTAACALAVATFVPLWLAALAGTVVAVVRLRRRPLRGSARRLAQRTRDALQAGSTLDEVAPQLASLLALYPHDDNARFLLALDRLQNEQPLEALIQLAPLRSRHPDVAEVTLATTLAELRLGRWSRAEEALGAIDLDEGQVWEPFVHQLERACRSKARQLGPQDEAGPSVGR